MLLCQGFQSFDVADECLWEEAIDSEGWTCRLELRFPRQLLHVLSFRRAPMQGQLWGGAVWEMI
jgi:hypothetical protein